MNVTLQISNAFVPRFYMTHTNFPGDWTNSCTVIASIFFENAILKHIKQIEKIHMDSEKSMNSFEMKKG